MLQIVMIILIIAIGVYLWLKNKVENRRIDRQNRLVEKQNELMEMLRKQSEKENDNDD